MCAEKGQIQEMNALFSQFPDDKDASPRSSNGVGGKEKRPRPDLIPLFGTASAASAGVLGNNAALGTAEKK